MTTIKMSRNELQLARGRIQPMFLRYALPGVISMLFLALQTMVDGWIVGRLISADALAAINITMPIYAIVTAITIVIGVGTQAQIGLHLGCGNYAKAKCALWSGSIGLTLFTIIGTLFINIFPQTLVSALGANEVLMHHAIDYVHGVMPWLIGITTLFFLDYQLKVMGQPRIAMVIMTTTIILNTTFSLIFVGLYDMGTFGAGLGTGVSFSIGAIIYVFYFIKTIRNNKEMQKEKGVFSWEALWHICYNGSSEGFTEMAVAIMTFTFNITLMEYAGKNGVAAFTLVNNILYFGICIALGVSNGIVPIISYNYGAKQFNRVHKVTKLAVKTNLICGIFFIAILYFFSKHIIKLFVDTSEIEVINIATYGATLSSLAFLFNGFNIFLASYFTAIDLPKLSILIAALRGLIFLIPLIIGLPIIWGINGVWLSIPIAELGTMIIGLHLLKKTIR